LKYRDTFGPKFHRRTFLIRTPNLVVLQRRWHELSSPACKKAVSEQASSYVGPAIILRRNTPPVRTYARKATLTPAANIHITAAIVTSCRANPFPSSNAIISPYRDAHKPSRNPHPPKQQRIPLSRPPRNTSIHDQFRDNFDIIANARLLHRRQQLLGLPLVFSPAVA